MMNEDIHGGDSNIMLWDNGFIVASKELVGPDELVTDYGDEYDWDEVKWLGMEELREKI